MPHTKQSLQFGSTLMNRPSPSSSRRIITGRSRSSSSNSHSYASSRASPLLLAFTSSDESTNSFGIIEAASATTMSELRSKTRRRTSLPSSSTAVSGSTTSKLPLLILTTVPMAFGSYATAIRLAGPLSDTRALVLQCMTYAIACCAIGGVRFVLYLLHRRRRQLDTATTTTSANASASIMRVTKLEWISGMQLGLLIAIAATLQSLGLQRTTAIRAGFLVRLSTIFVPLIDSLYIQHKLPSKLMITALMSSLVGVLLMVLSPTATVGTGGSTIIGATTLVGDVLVALSAVFYSTHILRLGYLAPKCNPMSLATTKSLTQLIISTFILSFSLLFHNIKNSLSSSSSVLSSIIIGQQLSMKINIPSTALYHIALYTGIVTCAFPMYAQGYGQQYIKSSYASLIYATAPVWNAIIAAVILKERLNIRGMIGAGFLIVGMISAIVASVRDG